MRIIKLAKAKRKNLVEKSLESDRLEHFYVIYIEWNATAGL